MGHPKKLITAADMDQMSPQQRADVVDAANVTSWNEVDPQFRDEIMETARQLGTQRRNDA